MKKIFFILLFFLLCTTTVHAQSSYVLPYPSTMPGGISYKLHVVWEEIIRYWYFGNFGQFEYNLKESDKYLVEAKTLFEYNQYLLGYNALQKSNDYFVKILPFLKSAESGGENIDDKQLLLQQAAAKHIEVLQQMENGTPNTFSWSPEKSAATSLHIHQLINTSIADCQKDL